MRLSILGGSSPFILELFLALERSQPQALSEIMLYGRDQHALTHIAGFAQRRLGIAVDWTCQLEAACDGFDVIIHQIRYGGLEGRDLDERLALAARTIPDESLGAAATSSIGRMRAPLAAVCAQLAARSPGAQVINMTNPLGLSTSLMQCAGLANPVGICELPVVTAQAAAEICGLGADTIEWDYAGLNHRGFLYNLTHRGENLLARIADSGIAKPFGGLGGDSLLEFGALPTKYFQLFMTGEPISAPGRAASLNRLRDEILTELIENPAAVPISLSRRQQPWWQDSVVPLLHALTTAEQSRHILNLVHPDGVTREGWAHVRRGSIVALDSPPLPPHPARWVAAFDAHERAALAYAIEPSTEHLQQVQRADPLSLEFEHPGLWRLEAEDR